MTNAIVPDAGPPIRTPGAVASDVIFSVIRSLSESPPISESSPGWRLLARASSWATDSARRRSAVLE
jgi:hypothetical protein